MFWNLMKLEYKQTLKRISTLILALVFFGVGFLMMNAIAGAFNGVRVMSSENLKTNSSFFIMLLSTSMNLFFMLFVGGYLSEVLLKDYVHDSYQLVYTKKVNKFNLLFTRIFVGLSSVSILLFVFQLGLIAGTFSPWLEREQFLSFSFLTYLVPYLYVSLTNAIIMTSIYTIVAVFSRKKLYVNLSAIIVFLIYSGIQAFSNQLKFKELTSILDIFGISSINLMTENWSISQRNTDLLSFSSYFLVNRAIWLTVALVLYIIAFKKFKFEYPLNSKKDKKSKKEENNEKVNYEHIAKPTINWSFITILQQFKIYFTTELKLVFKSTIFIVFSFVFLAYVISILFNQDMIYDTKVYPLTSVLIGNLYSSVMSFVVIFIAVFTGEVLWKSRTYKTSLLEDSSPIGNNVKVLSHLSAILTSVAFLWVIGTFVSIIYQMFNGVYHIQLSIYLTFGLMVLAKSFLFTCLALFIQNFLPNKMLGIIGFFAVTLSFGFLSNIGLEHPLWQVFSLSNIVYSDMNGYGPFFAKYLTYLIYWGGFASILLILTIKSYNIGEKDLFKDQIKRIGGNWNKTELTSSVIFGLLFVIAGSYIFYNENILNDYYSSKEQKKICVAYENNYKKFKGMKQPRITDVDLNVQIYPNRLEAEVEGSIKLKNKHEESISTLFLNMPADKDETSFEFDREYTLLEYNKDFGFYILELTEPLLANEELEMNFKENFPHKGYASGTNICKNGTFFNSSIFMPQFGYSDMYELSSNEQRKKYGLGAKERMASYDNMEARMNTYISNDSDWVNFKATVGTSAEQKAIAPGYLTANWVEDGRNQFTYEMDMPILKFFSFTSAKYEVKKDKWISDSGKEVSLEIYYNKGHDYNLDSMLKAAKMGLTYYSKNYMEYPHRQFRIIEFPRYATFAQSFPNTVPFSESIGFIAQLDDEKDIDYPFFVTSHELAHQWFAHVVIGANVKGAVMLSEAFAQYSALSIMEQEYGAAKMGTFLKHELTSYLTGRSSESSKEMPLSKVENQQYIHYNKGAIVTFALRKYLGEDKFNSVIKEFVNKYKYQEPPYVTTPQFLDILYRETPDSLQNLVHEMTEDIVLYDFDLKDYEVTKHSKKDYQIDMTIGCSKVRADSIGKEIEIPMDDYVEVISFADRVVNGKEKRIIDNKNNRWFKLKNGDNKISFHVKHRPKRLGVDPLVNLIDKNMWNNSEDVSEIKEL